jgi:hypothetical protein
MRESQSQKTLDVLGKIGHVVTSISTDVTTGEGELKIQK